MPFIYMGKTNQERARSGVAGEYVVASELSKIQ